MLTSDLVQARLYKKKVHPRYVDVTDPDYLDMAGQLIETFEEHVGRRRGELEAELEEILGHDTDFQLHRALAKLLMDRCTFEEESPLDPFRLRRKVFELSARAWARGDLSAAGEDEPSQDGAGKGGSNEGGGGQDRSVEEGGVEEGGVDEGGVDEAGDAEDEGEFRRHRFDRHPVLAMAAAELRDEALGGDDAGAGAEVEAKLTAQAVESGLYADLKGEQVLQGWKPCKPGWLLRRYNVALAQGVLLRALEMEIELGTAPVAKHRALFRKIKFFQLMHRIHRCEDGGWRIVLDGPASLFQSGTRYGFKMAAFLPTLLHFDDWSLKAKIAWGPKRRKMTFELDSSRGLRSHTRLTGQWQPEELQWLPRQLADLESGWRVSTDGELVNLGGEGVLVPDYVFTHEATGRQVVMEVFGFWNRGAIESRLKLLREHGPENLVLAISSQLATGREDLGETPTEVYVFRTHPIARKVLKRLEAFLD